MKTHDGSGRVQALKPKAGRVTLVPELWITVMGGALMARSVFDQEDGGDEVMWSAALGAVMVVIALTTFVRLRRWQPWAQAAVGGGLYIAALFFSGDDIDWITCAIGPVIVTLAMLELDAIESEDDHVRHRGWRQPATRPGRGLRLVYSAPRPRGAENADSEGQKPAGRPVFE
jgi:hypothetical protein